MFQFLFDKEYSLRIIGTCFVTPRGTLAFSFKSHMAQLWCILPSQCSNTSSYFFTSLSLLSDSPMLNWKSGVCSGAHFPLFAKMSCVPLSVGEERKGIYFCVVFRFVHCEGLGVLVRFDLRQYVTHCPISLFRRSRHYLHRRWTADLLFWFHQYRACEYTNPRRKGLVLSAEDN